MVSPQERRSWSNLPPELLELILQKLVLKDYLKCRRVCRSWRSAVNDALRIKNRCPPAPQFPYLLIIPHSLPKKEPSKLLDITQNTSHSIPTHDWEGKFHLVLSEEGWLMFQDTNKSASLFWIFNPVSGEKYELPPLSWHPNEGYRLTKAPYIVAAITPAPNPQNFLVAVYLRDYQWMSPSMQQLYFCRVTDKSWTLIKKTYKHGSQSSNFTEMVLLDWKLYAMNKYKTNSVTFFDLRGLNALRVERLDIQFPITRGVIRKNMMAKDSTCGEVLLVIISIKHGEIKEIQVLKMDTSIPRWIKVDSFNGRALLIDSEGAGVISTTKLSSLPEYTGGNCVFFSVPMCYPSEDSNFGVYFLKDKTIRHLPVDFLKDSDRCLWFTPYFW